MGSDMLSFPITAPTTLHAGSDPRMGSDLQKPLVILHEQLHAGSDPRMGSDFYPYKTVTLDTACGERPPHGERPSNKKH